MKNLATNVVNPTKIVANIAQRAVGETKVGSVSLKGKAKATPKVSTELLSIEDAVKSYNSIATTRMGHLVKMKAIGDLLVSLREQHDSDKLFGAAIQLTPLKVISRWDRNDMQWLSANWDEVKALKKDKHISSTSVNYLRKLIAKAAKAEELKKNPLPLVDAKDSGVSSDTDKGNGVTETGSHKRDVVDIAKTAIAECNNNNITVKQLIAALQSQLTK
tara:strand:- start:533 stop:1186 length:654 start_codon:yes stop_codon:yes gene_type:complete